LYGKTITNKEKYTKVQYVARKDTSDFINNPLFQHLAPINDELYEVQTRKATINHDLPIQIGFWVYSLAKMRMLEFYYDFLDKFFDRSKFELSQMDTDSMYMAIAGDKLEDILKPDMQAAYYLERHLWLPADRCDACADNYVTHKSTNKPWKLNQCCLKRQAFDKRTPGLFKLEFKGEKILSLCSKSYICVDGSQSKMAHKGVNGNQNDLRFNHYEHVLDSCSRIATINRGMRVWGKKVNTYQQAKVGLTCIYVKRQVQSDGVSTLPLEL
jgi:hypothetical protein